MQQSLLHSSSLTFSVGNTTDNNIDRHSCRWVPVFNKNTMIKQFIQRIFSTKEPQTVDCQPEFKCLEKALELWKKEKRYRRCDQSHDEIARELNTSNKILNSYFSEVVKQDFRTWRTQLRIGDAKDLLLERKDLSIQLISEMAGFSDRSNFHRQFTKIVGCSPKQWRESGGIQEC